MGKKTSKDNSIAFVEGLRDGDICCGRGKGFLNHPGNQEFQKILQSNLARYTKAETKNEKSKVVSTIVSELRASGARFVKKDKASGKWYDIGAGHAHEKTGHAIRDYILNKSKRQAKQAIEQKFIQQKRAQKRKSKSVSKTSKKAKNISFPDLVLETTATIHEIDDLAKEDLLCLHAEATTLSDSDVDLSNSCAPQKSKGSLLPDCSAALSSLRANKLASQPITSATTWLSYGINLDREATNKMPKCTTKKQILGCIDSFFQDENMQSEFSICKNSVPLFDLSRQEVLEVCSLLSEFERPEEESDHCLVSSVYPSDWL